MGELDLNAFHVSEHTGFLLENPLLELPEYFKEWNLTAANLQELIRRKEVRNAVEKIPELDHTKLTSYQELRLAHLQLSLIAGCYVWQEGDEGVPKVLPRNIAVPYYGISEVLGIKPILLHSSLVLSNWKRIDVDKQISLDNLECIYCLPGGREAEWFIIVTVAVEYEFAKGLKYLMSALRSADIEDEAELTKSLHGMKQTIMNMKSTVSKMHEELSADTFYNVLRPYLAGWGGEGSPLPHGLIYEGVNDKPIQMNGASAAQSSTCQTFDAALGIDQSKPVLMIGGSAAQSSTMQSFDAALSIDHVKDVKNFLITMRQYMPPRHKQFIEEIEKRTQIRRFVRDNPQNQELQTAFNNCLTAMVEFRNYHIQIVTKYIVIASTRRDSSYKYESVSDKGTGGTSILPFLKTIRDSSMNDKI